MSDCTGYGFNHTINLCLNGPVGGGSVADLTVQIEDLYSPAYSQNFDSTKSVVVQNWAGSRVTIDVTSLLRDGSYSFVGAPCELKARLTLTPDGGGSSGNMLLEFIFTDCSPSVPNSGYASVFEECNGAGPHIVSEMSTFNLDGAACV